MNRLIILLLLTIALIIGVISLPELIKKSYPDVRATRLSDVSYCETVTSPGEVYKLNQRFIQNDFPLVVGELLVSSGEVIRNSQPILTVDKQKTVERMMLQTEYSDIVEYGAKNLTYDDMINEIPDTVNSDTTGTIGSINVSEGEFILRDTKIAEITGATDLCVKALIPESEISKIKKGQKAIITGTAFDDKEYFGVVEEISSTATKQLMGAMQNTSVGVTVRFSNADEKIRVGNTAKVKILVSDEKTVSVIPYDAIHSDDMGNAYVYVFSQGTAVKKDIKTGEELKEGIEIRSGINAHDTVLFSDEKIKDGEYIKIISTEE